MSALRSLLSVLRARWFWSLVGAVVLSLLVWFFGDLVAVGETRPLGTPVARLVVILCIAVVWGAWNLLAQARARRSNEKLVAALAEPAARRAPGSEEVAELDRRFLAALDQLRHRRLGGRGGRRWLYQLPWYVMIGPPASGKTTALAQSGLSLRAGQIQELRGVGGTRYCDWVFTDEAVLIDTAGRYTTQESDPEADKAAWLGFLDLLRERRPRQPLNGVLVAISTRDLLQAGGVDHAARIRARLDEIEGRLGLRLPVYLLVTKADLIAGFEPFFADLGEAEREQVWGHSFARQPGHTEPPSAPALRDALAGLVARLDRRLPRRLAAEQDLARRAQVFGFPAQVASLSDEIVRFAERCFRASTYERGAWLRGVYLTSGTQTGTPVDRLMATIARSIGSAVPAPSAASGDRSFFLRRLLEGVVFGEASLAGRDLARDTRDRLVRGVALASLAVIALATLGAWTWSYAGNRDRHERLAGELEAWGRQARPFAHTRLTSADADFTAVLPLLDRLGDISQRLARADPLALRMGLSQRATAEAQLGIAYRNALSRMLLPRLALTTEAGLRRHLQEPDALVEELKTYLSLVGRAPVEPQLLEELYALEAEARAPPLVASARRHVAALAAILPGLEQSERPAPDQPLVAEAQAVLARMPLAQRAYRMLVSSPAVAALPGWRVTDVAGPSAPLALTRRSGQPLGAEIPAVFTYDGFHQLVLPSLDEVARAAYAEYWVLSGRGTPDASEADIRKLKSDMLQLHYTHAVAAWDALLKDVTVAPMGTLERAVEVTRALSGPNSPLKLLLAAVLRETSLTVPPQAAQPPAEGTATAALRAAAQSATSRVDRLSRLVRPGGAAAAATETPGAPVEARFAHLRPLVEGASGGPPLLDEVAAAFGAAHAKLAEAQASPNPAEAFARMGTTWAQQLAATAQRMPEPLQQMLASAPGSAAGIARSGALQQLNAVWRTDVLQFCRAAIGGRFPFSPGSPADANTEDVARLFGPNGLIDGFVKGPLANFVDTTRPQWRDSQGIGLSGGALQQLARARRITSALFASGAGPKASFSMTPLALSGNAASATLAVDGQELRYAHGPGRPVAFVWPAPSGANIVRLSFAPSGGGPPLTVLREGPWALFRLLHESGRFARTDQPDLFVVELAAGGYALSLRLRAASVENPFNLSLFAGFACPEGL
ncbi:type VI secretion system membrane subunit TssM [Falsiroseomonas sp.]|uniref:type VI secretion system membrane subunit TssM n=1 Tax=Falsiroseomonas sp. TaxID=2870721 RepID=UPI0035681B98